MAIKENICTEPDEAFKDLPEGSLRLLQLTDCHLYADDSATLMGVNSLNSLHDVIGMAAQHMPVDAILATGDLVHDGSAAGYRQLTDSLKKLRSPVFSLPGNHDDPRMMQTCLNQPPMHYQKLQQLDNWLLIMLDSTIPGSATGNLAEAELNLLRSTLSAHQDKHILICLHHNPVPVQSRWLDTMMVQNAESFFSIIDQYTNIRGILWGHVHQSYDHERNGVRLMATPSTCVQFERFGDDFGTDMIAPGCRWLGLLPDGKIRSCIQRTDKLPTGLEISNRGYR